MIPIPLLAIVLCLLFIVCNFCWSQRLYLSQQFDKIAISFIIMIPLCSFWLVKQEDRLVAINFGLLIPYYLLLLFAIRKWYNKLNDFLIKKHLIESTFSGKVFTYVYLEETTGAIWDEKRVSAPSLLDHALSLVLVFVPMLLTLPYIYWDGNAS